MLRPQPGWTLGLRWRWCGDSDPVGGGRRMSYGNNPIEKLAQDHLSRATVVQALKTLLNDPALDTPLALGIYGEWGGGKTSVMQMLINDVPTNSLWV